jgi:hypothetical protein
MRTVGSNVANGNDCHSLVALYWKQPLDSFHVIVGYRLLPSRLDKAQASLALFSLLRQLSHPARAKATVSGCEAKVLHGNAEVDVAMVLVVVCSHPSVVQTLEAKHEHWHIGEPGTVIALSHLLLALFRSND